jgi:hypothetical protein
MFNKENLDKRICDCVEDTNNTQTFREYIRESEEEFGIDPKELDNMKDYEIHQYINWLDYLWEK